MSNATLIIGIGNRYRGDDALGCLVAEELREHAREGVDVIEHDGEPASLIDSWRGYDRIMLVDAVVSGSEPGMVHRIDLGKHMLPKHLRSHSTHTLGVGEAVELARALDKLPPHIIFYGLEVKSLDWGMPSKYLLKRWTTKLKKQILNELGLTLRA